MTIFEFGSGTFEFSSWPTPFENAGIEVLEVIYCPSRPSAASDADLIIRVYVYKGESIYRLSFKRVSAFRVLDEAGLGQLWQKTEEFGGRPGKTTFRVRNHHWTEESVCSFIGSDGWSFVIASDDDCVEIVAGDPPSIRLEDAPT